MGVSDPKNLFYLIILYYANEALIRALSEIFLISMIW